MKLPKSFRLEKCLENKIERWTRPFTHIEDLIAERVWNYKLNNQGSLSETIIASYFKYIKSTKQVISAIYHNDSWSGEIEITAFEFNKKARDCILGLYDEIKIGQYSDNKHLCCMIRYEYALIIKPEQHYWYDEDTDTQHFYIDSTTEEAMEEFKKFYRKKYGFC